ncbi:hypothetical protein [Streptomyces sp. NBC_00996]|nr:hypothetical protein OG390_01455 [Streptomyces sp. NBC_00996]
MIGDAQARRAEAEVLEIHCPGRLDKIQDKLQMMSASMRCALVPAWLCA